MTSRALAYFPDSGTIGSSPRLSGLAGFGRLSGLGIAPPPCLIRVSVAVPVDGAKSQRKVHWPSYTPLIRSCSKREREGVEPTAPTEGPGPTDLKSAKPTGAHPLPGTARRSRRRFAWGTALVRR